MQEQDKATEAMLAAAAEGYAGGVMRLAEAGADLSARDEQGLTALDHMLARSQYEAAGRLIDMGADTGDVNARLGQSDFTPLHFAAWLGRSDWAQKLLDRGAPTEARSNGGMTPLCCALRQEQIECAQTLKVGGADVKTRYSGAIVHESMLTLCARMALSKSVFWCLKNKADGGEPEKEAQRAIGYLSQLDVSVEGQRDALAGTVAYLEAAQISASSPSLGEKARKAQRPGL